MTKARNLASFNALGVLTSTSTLDATKLLGDLPALNAAALLNLTPDNLISAGTIPSALLADVGGGKILQVVHSSSTSSTGVNVQNTYVDVDGSSISITPTSSTSKILHMFHTGMYGSDNAGQAWMRVYRDSTVLREVQMGRRNNANEDAIPLDSMFIDSPNTISEITYKVQAKKSSNNNPLYINNGSNTAGISNILMEIAA